MALNPQVPIAQVIGHDVDEIGALRSLSESDPLVRGELLNDSFWLHEVAPNTKPLVHVSTTKRAEVVLFGKKATLRAPFSFLAGDLTVTATEGDTRCIVSRTVRGQTARKPCSLELGEVLRTMAALGGQYPEALAILQQAEPVADRLVGRSPDTGARRAPAITRALAVLFAATLVAEGSLLPVAAYAFSQVTAAGLLLNFVAVPLMTVAQCAGLATLIGALVHPACAAVPGWIAAAAAAGIVWSASFVDAVPWTVRHVPPPPFWLVAAMTLAWWLAWHGPARRHRRGAAVVWATCGALLLAGRLQPAGPGLPLRDAPCPPPGGPSGGAWLRAIFLDVGQGDATFVRFPDGREWLIDAGGSLPGSRFDVGARIVAPALWALSTRRLDALIVTHGDHDHAGGVPAVLDRFAVRELWEGLAVAGAPVLERVRTRAALHGTGARRVRRGDAIRAGPVAVHVRHPGDGGVRTRVRNDDSVVLELRHGDVSLLLPGDAGGAVEQEIAPLIPRVPIRVLRAAHHGSARSTGTRWLDAIDPALVVISAGRGNPYGHPSPALLDRLRRRGTPWLRTDVDGAVLIDTDGAVVRVTTCGGRTLLFGKDDGPRRAGTAPVQPLGGRP